MGGKDSQNGGGVMENSFKTTQLLDGGGYESGFDLTIPSFYSCSIDDPASGHVIITGGVINDQGEARWGAEIYSETGLWGNVANMNHPRMNHGCAGYYNDKNDLVS